MAVSGYDYQSVKKELLKFENIDPKDLIKRPKNRKKSKPGPKVYFNSVFDPRLPHPRKIISKNYEILAKSEDAKNLFPRKNIIASSKRLPNLGEILSPTIQSPNVRQGDIQEGDQPQPPADGQDDSHLPARGRGRGRGRGKDRGSKPGPQPPARGQKSTLQPALVEEEVTWPARGQNEASEPANMEQELGAIKKQINGSYHCQYHRRTEKCDFCKHITEGRSVFSSHFKVKHSIAGNNVHLKASLITKYNSQMLIKV